MKKGISSYLERLGSQGSDCEHDSVYLPESDIPFSAHLESTTSAGLGSIEKRNIV